MYGHGQSKARWAVWLLRKADRTDEGFDRRLRRAALRGGFNAGNVTTQEHRGRVRGIYGAGGFQRRDVWRAGSAVRIVLATGLHDRSIITGHEGNFNFI